MTESKITIEQLARFMGDHIPATFNVFDENREKNNDYNAASWARGRIDAYFQILEMWRRQAMEATL